MAAKHDLENLLNGQLAVLLTGAGVDAQAEVKQGNRRLDILADVDGLRVVLEAETGYGKRRQAVKDADARLKQNLTVIAFAVCYPDGATVAELANAELQWSVRTSADAEWSDGDWSQGNVLDLCQAVRLAPVRFDDVDGAAKILSQGLDAGAQRLTRPQRRALARALNLPDLKTKTKKTDGYFTAAKRGLLVVATAMLFHQRVLEHLPDERPEHWSGEWPPKTAAACSLNRVTAIQDFDQAWEAILAVDYRPVFATAREALAALPANVDAGHMVQALARVVEQVARLVSGMRHDLLGRIFHRVLDTARYDGSFYTSTAAATLLANLAIRADDRDWSDADAVSEMRICDPACGTGTLLMAAARRIHDLREHAGKGDLEDETLLAEALVEDVLWGYDINISATHMAASALGMLSPKTSFRNMNIHIPKFGIDERPRVGSLELLDNQMELDNMPGSVRQVESGTSQSAEQPKDIDLVIMNPPFTRDSLRYDQFTRKEELKLKEREKEVVGRHHHSEAVHLSGGSSVFLVLAEHLAHSRRGSLASVIPTVSCTAPSGAGARRLLARRFHIETIVSSHDPERIFMSENTKIGEVLIVGRRWSSEEEKPPTRFVNLAVNPNSGIDAQGLAQRLESGAEGDFTIQHVKAERIAKGDWNAVNFLSPFLVGAYRSLAEDQSIALTSMSNIAEVGPAGRRIRDAYTKSDVPTASGRRALWEHKTDVTQAMRAKTDKFIEPKKSKQLLADKYWQQRSRLLLPHRLWLPLARVCAVALDQSTVGSIWTPCRPHDESESTAKALAVYLNSSIGVLSLLGGRDNRKPSYPQFSLDTLRSLQVPNFNQLTTEARDALATTYDWRQDDILLPLPEMDDDPVRKQLDEAVTAALGLDADWVAQVRLALSEEPSITNRRFGT